MKKIVMFGASGHAKVVWDAIKSSKKFELVGVEDPKLSAGEKWLGEIPVLSFEEAIRIGAGVIAIGENHVREKIASAIKSANRDFSFETIIHSKSIVSETCRIGKGTVIFAGAIINADSSIGDHVILNTGCIIEHDCKLEDFSFVGPNAAIGGNVKVGKYSFIGIGASLNQGITIGENVLIGNGSAVISSFPRGDQTIFGNPASGRNQREPKQNFF